MFLERRRVDELLCAHRAAVRRFSAVTQHVRLEVAVLVEAPLADEADERPEAGVFVQVFTQTVGAGERAAALVTRMGPVACVTSKVFLEVAQLGKRLGADVAREWFLPTVCPHVSLQVRRVRELHRAYAARKRAVVVVHPHVLLQVRLLRKLALAQITGDRRTIGVVRVEVAFQRSRADEPHSADRTSKRSLSRMNAHVSLERRRLRELLVAENAVVRTITGVYTHVLFKGAVFGEPTIANVADKRTQRFRAVAACVALQLGRLDKSHAAIVTGVLLCCYENCWGL